MERCTFLSAAANELHADAKHLHTNVDDVGDHLQKASHILIAVERHDKDSEQWRNEAPKDRYLWVKGRSKIKVHQIRDSYLNSYSIENPTLSVALTMDRSTLDGDTRIGDLDYFRDQIVVIKAEELPNSIMYPVNPPTPVSNLESSHGHPQNRTPRHTPSRQPLQPVNRQLTVPTRESLDGLKPPKREGSQESSQVDMHSWSNKGQGDFLRKTGDRNGPSAEPKLEGEMTPGEPRGLEPAPELEESQDYKPREIENPFAVEDDDGVEQNSRGEPLRQLALNTTPERLEAGVKAGVDLLDKLHEPLTHLQDHPDAESWLEQIAKVRNEATQTRTVVGVVGNTGAGKSSVINAMLDEERLVPTNCMRACTAVVTELSYNHSKSENSKYRAEVEFIKPEDWRKELRVLFEEVFDESGRLVRDARSPESQAGIAYAKIRAVYHKHTEKMLSEATVESLMRVKQVNSILGTTRRINERLPDSFYRRLQHYVDSKEKGEEKLDKNGNKIGLRKREFEFWPLIKVVKLYTKADALSTGAVIVDLPGVHDSNAARAAVAEGYMKQCTGLWIVAPINRAVDDKAAKTLLGNTFKRQLKYDGTYSAVTFICSKTDDISRTEAADTLQLGTDMKEIEERLTVVERQRRELSKQLKEARATKQDHSSVIENIEDEIEKWEELETELQDGKTVYAPSASGGKKRKRPAKTSPDARSKRRRRVDFDDDDDDVLPISSDDGDDDGDDAASAEDRPRVPLTEEEIKTKMEELKTIKSDARRERSKIDDSIQDIRKQILPLQDEEADLDARQSELCIAGRNEYSRSAIRQDFAAGIRELDHENAEEEDPDNFNPDEDVRDYEEVASSLPVYCVSSRAYQQLSGRMQKDSEVPGFTAKQQTEVPQLQAHCKKLTERGRQANSRRFLNSLNSLLTSLGLWSSDDGTGAKLTTQQRDTEKAFLSRRLKELEKALEKTVTETLNDATLTLDEQLFDKFDPAITMAANEAGPTSSKWGAHRNDGGLPWATYKATTRRAGVFQGSRGFQDFNAQLTEPIYKQLASTWEKAFQRRLPHILQAFTKSGSDLLKKFHSAIESRCREKGHGVARISLLANNLNAYQAIFKDLAGVMVTQINDGQREINREFTPVVTSAMEHAYELCTDEKGTGSFKRMKDHMANHIDTNKSSMFSAACEQVRNSLSKLCDDIRQQMLDRTDGVYVNMQRDYMSIVGGVNVGQVSMSREERVVRRQLDESISAIDQTFQTVLESGLETLRGSEGSCVEDMDVDEQVDEADDDNFESDRESGEDDEDEVEEGSEEDEVEAEDDVESASAADEQL